MKLKPIYKSVKIMMPHCPNCKEQLRGNNSIAMPWNCSCGEWHNSPEDLFNYEVETKK